MSDGWDSDGLDGILDDDDVSRASDPPTPGPRPSHFDGLDPATPAPPSASAAAACAGADDGGTDRSDGGDGWDDSDIDLSSDDGPGDDGRDGGEGGAGEEDDPPPPHVRHAVPPCPQPRRIPPPPAVPPTPPRPPPGGGEDREPSSAYKTMAMLADHEALMRDELDGLDLSPVRTGRDALATNQTTEDEMSDEADQSGMVREMSRVDETAMGDEWDFDEDFDEDFDAPSSGSPVPENGAGGMADGPPGPVPGGSVAPPPPPPPPAMDTRPADVRPVAETGPAANPFLSVPAGPGRADAAAPGDPIADGPGSASPFLSGDSAGVAEPGPSSAGEAGGEMDETFDADGWSEDDDDIFNDANEDDIAPHSDAGTAGTNPSLPGDGGADPPPLEAEPGALPDLGEARRPAPPARNGGPPPNDGPMDLGSLDDDAGDDGDGWSDDDDFFSDDLPSTDGVAAPPPPVGAPPPPPPPGPEPASPVAARTRSRRAASNGSDGPPPPPHDRRAASPARSRVHSMLARYVRSVSDPDFASGANAALRSNTSAGAGADLRDYYAARSGLRRYTLGVELDRMDYALVLHDGTRVEDGDVIRSYFGVTPSGDRADGRDDEGDGSGEATAEEILVRSANQSLLADALAGLTGPEDGPDSKASLVLSGPSLCMTSVAESCSFVLDLREGRVEATCGLAVSVPCHGPEPSGDDGRAVLARADVSVRFSPGDGSPGGEGAAVDYRVLSVDCPHGPDSDLVRSAAACLAEESSDPFSDFGRTGDAGNDGPPGGAQDVRDLFLIEHSLLNPQAVDRLRSTALASAGGLRSALRQIDGVAGVSARVRGLGLGLPSAGDIEAAEREAAEAAGRAPPAPFPRPHAAVAGPDGAGRRGRRAPPPPPPPPPPGAAPRPLIGGLFMSGLSRLAAAAPRPESSGWEGGGGTGLTPPPSPGRPAPGPVLRLETEPAHQAHHPAYLGGGTGLAPPGERMPAHQQPAYEHGGGTGLTPPRQQPAPRNEPPHAPVSPPPPPSGPAPAPPPAWQQAPASEGSVEDVDAGWSDDEFDFDDGSDSDEEEEEEVIDIAATPCPAPSLPGGAAARHAATPTKSIRIPAVSGVDPLGTRGRGGNAAGDGRAEAPPAAPAEDGCAAAPPPPPPPGEEAGPPRPPATVPRPEDGASSPTSPPSFDSEYVVVLKDRIESERAAAEKTGRLRRWEPVSEDAVLGRRLVGAMVAQLGYSQ